jgi:hypothetical protein
MFILLLVFCEKNVSFLQLQGEKGKMNRLVVWILIYISARMNTRVVSLDCYTKLFNR